MSLGSFQKQVNTVPAVGVAGDFASSNPRYSVDAGPGGLIAGTLGVLVGLFAWVSYSVVDGDGAPAAVNNFGSGQPAGIVPRLGQGLITDYYDGASMQIPRGFQMAVISAADMWIQNDGITQATRGMVAFARYADGKARFAAAGSAASGASGSASSIAANSSLTFTGGIQGNLLTVSAVGAGTIYPGATVAGSGVASGTKVVAQLLPLDTGEALGGVGRYSVDVPEQDVDAGTAMTGTYGVLTVGGTVAGVFGVGDTLSGTNVVAGTKITALISGTGGAGTYAVDNNTVVSSTAITAATDVETKWTCQTSGLPGELVKVSRVPN